MNKRGNKRGNQTDKRLLQIEVSASLLQTEMPDREAFICALDSSTIGISGKDEPDWREIAGFQDKIALKTAAGKTIIALPERFSRFYDLRRKNRVVSFNGGHILITVNGERINDC